MQCKKCGNKGAKELYYRVKHAGYFNMSVNEKGYENTDWGGYDSLDDFIDFMLQEEMEKRELLGCDKCIGTEKEG